MKAAILTIQSDNYGNRLQNFALQKVLSSYGYQVESLRRYAGFGNPIVRTLRNMKHSFDLVCKHDKKALFNQFDRRISFSKYVVSPEYITPSMDSAFEMFVMGSDQIWNPDFHFNSDLEYLPFVPSCKKIAYAASFGVTRIDSDKMLTAFYLHNISRISVREDAGAEIVSNLIGYRPEVVIDPTMLLTANEWSQIAIRPHIDAIHSPYLLKYVLGDDIHGQEIDELARSRGLGVVDLTVQSLPVGPAEFVWLIGHADMVCIDSFHGSVFSLLFHRPFIIYERQSADADMSSRFDTLCRLFGMDHHRVGSTSFDLDRCFNEDWTAFEFALSTERQKSLDWLSSAIEQAGHATS